MFEKKSTFLNGCIELQPVIHEDERGHFVKTWHQPTFEALGLHGNFSEQYYNVSAQNVLRGLHFQHPPHACKKLIYCTQGEVLDALLDLRIGSTSYGKHHLLTLSAQQGNILYIPEGFAHGFLVRSTSATIIYNTTCPYSAADDDGIAWNSAGIAWPVEQPILSTRDKNLTPLCDFKSRFV